MDNPLAILERGSSRPHRLHTAFSAEGLIALRALIHRSHRDFGFDTSVWTRDLLAQVSFQLGLTSTVLTGEAVRKILKRLGINWKRAKHRISSPDPQYREKTARDRLIAWASQQASWAIGFLDEVWWSRFALPPLHGWRDPEHLCT